MQDRSGPCGMNNNLATRLRPGQFVDDVFQVSGLAKRTRNQGRDHFFLMTLANGAGRFDAIAGEAAGRLALGQVVRVLGCVLIRRREPIMVAFSLRPTSTHDTTLQRRSYPGGKPRSARLRDAAHRSYPRAQREAQ